MGECEPDCLRPSRWEAERDAQYDPEPEPDNRPWVLPEWMGGTEEAEDPQRAVDDADDARADQDWGWE